VGQIVSADALTFELWGDSPPPTASNLVSVYVHQLRRAIGDEDGRVLVHRRPGYQALIGGVDTDLQEFESLSTRGRDALGAGNSQASAALLAEAEGLWRGQFLADVAPSVLVSTEAERTTELRLSTAELRITAELECGRYAEVIPRLRRMVAEHPLRERLWLLLMRALRDAGRYAESVSTYGQARLVIAGQLGVDPGPELQQSYADLLAAAGPVVPRGDSLPVDPRGRLPGTAVDGVILTSRSPSAGGVRSEAAGLATAGTAGPLPVYPAQLPADIADFTGREAHVNELCGLLSLPDADALRVLVVAGAAGLGKTALAVHAAHRVRALFPDGQLYADLRGTSACPAEPGEVLSRFLRDLGVDGGKIPADGEERAALFRTRISGHRMLILLDNARDAAQVRSLLPGSPSCGVIVASRDRTLQLLGGGFIDLGTLPRSEALELFSRIAGNCRAAAEPEATAQIIAACGGLPLALRICAARLAQRRQWQVATLATRLREERRRLDELRIGDLEVRASFQVSYDSLAGARAGVGADPMRVFRLLGLWPGQRISLPAAAALVSEPEAEAAGALETLVDANLLESPEPDWYQFHDLLRLFAAERAQAEEPEEERRAASQRLLRRYREMAAAAAEIVAPQRYRLPGELRPSAAATGSVTEALAWYDSEQGNVIPVLRQAAEAGLHEGAWRLATALYPSFVRRDNWADCVTAHRIAVDSARAAGTRPGEAWVLNNLGSGLHRLGKKEAFSCLKESLAIRREIGDLDGEAQTLISLADAYYRLKGPREAYDHSLRDMEVLRRAGNPEALATGLNNHGEFCLDLGRLEEAAECFGEALAVWTPAKGHGLGYALRNLGRVHLRTGRLDEAITTLTEAHRHHLSTGHIMEQARALKYLAEAQRESGHHDQARESLTKALALFKELRADQEAKALQSAITSMESTSV
jgi:DNA-binding SARP family transcriptional activator